MNASTLNRTEVNGGARLDKNRVRLAVVFLILLTMAAYLPTLSNDFVAYDDPSYILNCEMVKPGVTLRGLAWAFTAIVAAMWHPLTLIGHMLNCQLFGVNPGGHHLVSLLLHLANVILFFILFKIFQFN